MTRYTLSFSYPDGHIEEIEEIFVSLQSAIDYGNGLLNQVKATEIYKKGSLRGRNKPYFTILEMSEEGTKVAFNSAKQ